MRDKEHLKILLEIVRWQIKGMRGFFFIPCLVLCVLQPLYMLLVLWVGYGFDNVYIYDEITSEVMRLCPPLSLWWTLWVLKKYLEDDERELYYTNVKIKWAELFLYYLIYVAAVAVMLLIYAHWIGVAQSLYLLFCTAAVSFFYHAAAYWFSYLTKSATLILIPFLFYTFWVMMPHQYYTGGFSYINLFYGSHFQGILWGVATFLVGGILVKMGKRENKKYHAY